MCRAGVAGRNRPLHADVLQRHPVPLQRARLRRGSGAVPRQRRPLRVPGVPRAHRGVRVLGGPADACRVRGAVDRRTDGRGGAVRPRRPRQPRAVHRRERAAAVRVRAGRGLGAGLGASRPAVGRGAVRGRSGAAADGTDQLGPAGGRAARDRAARLVAITSGARRGADRAGYGGQAVPPVRARPDPGAVSAGSEDARVLAGAARRGRVVAGDEPAVRRRQLRGLGDVLVVQLRTRRRPRVAVVRVDAGGSRGVRARHQRGLVGLLQWRVCGDRGAGAGRAASSATGTAGVPGGGGVPAREQGLLPAVRPVAAAAGRTGPATLA